jgi:hypothetical protein
MVEHHHFFGDAERVVHRGDVEQRAEAQPLGPLRHRGEEHAGRGRHAERRRMMFGDMIGAKAGAIVLFDELEPRLEQIPERNAVVVEMIENAELERHGLSSLSFLSMEKLTGPELNYQLRDFAAEGRWVDAQLKLWRRRAPAAQ